MKRLIPRTLVLLVFVGAVGMGAWWLLFFRSQGDTVVARKGDVVSGVVITGTVRVKERTQVGVGVSSEAVATIASWEVKEGDYVKEPGKVLVQLDDSIIKADYAKAKAEHDRASAYLAELKAGPREGEKRQVAEALKRAEAEHEHAQVELTQMEEALSANAATESEVRTMRTRVAVARARLEAARAEKSLFDEGTRQERIEQAEATRKLAEAEVRRCVELWKKYRIVAPHAGRVTARYFQAGEIVRGGDRLLLLENTEKIEVIGHAQESQLSDISVGDRATIISDSFPDQPAEGVVEEILRIDPARGTVEILLKVGSAAREEPNGADEGPSTDSPAATTGGKAWMHGGTVDIQLTHEVRRDVICIPVEAVEGAGEDATVQVKTATGFERRPVKLGVSDGTWVEAVEGIQEGDILRIR